MDKNEFEAKILACSGRYYRIAKAILISDADCEDAMQEAMMKAWSRLAQLRTPDLFETWLCRILINECKAILRQRKRRPTDILQEAIPAPEPPDRVLWDALIKLDSRFRIPFTLHHADGYSLAETARILNLPVTTVKWRIHRARELLSGMVTKEDML